jgi:membrane protease YdiL (CAAX protease family)
MNRITAWDHAIVLIVFVAYPLIAWRSFPAFVKKVRRYGARARIAGYKQTILFWDIAGLALIAVWLVYERSWAELGIRAAMPGQLAAGLGVGAVLVAVILMQQYRRIKTGLSAELLARQLGDLEAFMPRSGREQRWFRVVAVNAGVTEELIARGFLLWYLEPLIGMVWGPLLAVVAFAGAHAYQGLRQMPGLLVASAAFVALYLVSGSLLLPILFHAILDLVQGHFITRALNDAAPMTASGAGPSA